MDPYWTKYTKRYKSYSPLTDHPLVESTSLIICIPATKEENLIATLDSLEECDHVPIHAEVILLFNKNESMTMAEKEVHDRSWDACHHWLNHRAKTWLTYIPVYIDHMPDPKGGVGWARKLAMDEAAFRLGKNGIILSLDADCRVEKNYVHEVVDQFALNEHKSAASIYFQHPIEKLREGVREAIIRYELHLRYLVQAQKWCGHPYAFHTVGSCMAVRRDAYLAQGGMNTRRAGEDFYFLQKFIETDQLFNLTATSVYPSARISDRVPFGTGRAMLQIQEGKSWLTTNFETFRMIKPLFENLGAMYEAEAVGRLPQWLASELDPELIRYLQTIDFEENVRSIVCHTASYRAFRKRFFRYFNAFGMIRFMHYMRDHFYHDVPVEEAAASLLTAVFEREYASDAEELLQIFRRMDRERV